MGVSGRWTAGQAGKLIHGDDRVEDTHWLEGLQPFGFLLLCAST